MGNTWLGCLFLFCCNDTVNGRMLYREPTTICHLFLFLPTLLFALLVIGEHQLVLQHEHTWHYLWVWRGHHHWFSFYRCHTWWQKSLQQFIFGLISPYNLSKRSVHSLRGNRICRLVSSGNNWCIYVLQGQIAFCTSFRKLK